MPSGDGQRQPILEGQALHRCLDPIASERLLREEIKFGFKSALAASAVDVDADAEIDFHEAFFEAKTLQLTNANEVIGVEYLVGDWEDFGNRPKIKDPDQINPRKS